MSREDDVFDTPAMSVGYASWSQVPKGQGSTHYVVSDEDLLWLVRQAKKVQAIKDYLEEFGTGGQAVWEFLNKDKPLPTLKEMPSDD